MKNKKTMIVKIDLSKQKVLNENLDRIVNDFIERNIDFELILIDVEYVIDSNINTIVNKYILDCKKENRPLVVGYKSISLFIENLMKFNRKMTVSPLVKVDEEKIPIDIITYDKKMYFCVDIPKDIISSEKQEELIASGQNYISGGLSNNVIFDYVLAPFYWFLYNNDLLNNEKYCDLWKYTFGLH